jgi:hypothetical protein
VSEKNKYNLGRSIKPSIKRAVRKRCGFGCIFCGRPIIQYHHFNPEFSNAEKHEASGITLLCANHHEEATKGILTTALVEEQNKNPYCIKEGQLKHFFYIAEKAISLKLGNACFKSLNIIMYDDTPIFRFERKPNGLLSFSASFFDENGRNFFAVNNNEWVTGIEHFDIEMSKNNFIIREKRGKGGIKFHFSHIANEEIYIKEMDIHYRGYRIQVKNNPQRIGIPFVVTSPDGGFMDLTCPNIYATLRLSKDGSIRI